jgi:ATP-dependent RNA helicase RhlE
MKFSDLQLTTAILRAVADEGYETATPIQHQAIAHILAGRDVLGCAQTGTGKTAAFALPILDRLASEPVGKRCHPRALVIAPTRELAQQIAGSFRTYGRRLDLSATVIYGGVRQTGQVHALRQGVDIVVATPGRLLDLIQQGHCDLSAVRRVVLDEADRMLDMGFMPDIKRIISHVPQRRQTLLFSATIPRQIRRLADALLRDPQEITVTPQSPAVERIAQSVYHVDKPQKPALLAHLLDTLSVSRAIVFARTRHGADRIVRQLNKSGTAATAIHGNKTQGARQTAMDQFRSGKTHVLVATDIAARGIDVDGISHVFNYDVARDPEGHVHRIGRTARAGAAGSAITLCDREELPHLKAIERLIRMELTVIGDVPALAGCEPRPRPTSPRGSHRDPRPNAGRSQPKTRTQGGRRPAHAGKPPRRKARGGSKRNPRAA